MPHTITLGVYLWVSEPGVRRLCTTRVCVKVVAAIEVAFITKDELSVVVADCRQNLPVAACVVRPNSPRVAQLIQVPLERPQRAHERRGFNADPSAEL
jgi:hypothetical protein